MAALILPGGAVGGFLVMGLLNFLLARSGRVRAAMLVCSLILLLIVGTIALSTTQDTFENRLLVNLALFWLVPALSGALRRLIFGRQGYAVRIGDLAEP